MNRSIQIILTLLTLAFCVILIRGIFVSPEDRIRQQLNALESLVSYDEEEGNLGAVSKVKRLGALFAEDVVVEVTIPGMGSQHVTGRQQVQQVALSTRSRARGLVASLVDIVIEVSEDETRATVEATGRAKVEGEPNPAIQDFMIHFAKAEDGWLITRVLSVDALR